EAYIALRRSLGFSLKKQAAILRSLVRYVELEKLDGPLTRAMALDFVLSWNGTANGRANRYGVVRRFADYLAIYDLRWSPEFGHRFKLGLLLRRTDRNDGQTEAVFSGLQGEGCS